jgi:hypothetical protein
MLVGLLLIFVTEQQGHVQEQTKSAEDVAYKFTNTPFLKIVFRI